MNMQYGTTALPGHVSEEAFAEGLHHAMRRVYLWMTLGLLVTGTVAFLVVSTPLLNLVANPIVFFGAMIAELIFVIVLSARVMRMAPMTAVAIFLVYAALNGITMSLVFAIYTSSSIAITFFVTACLFGAMSIVGYTTSIDLTRMGGFLLMALIGLIIGSIANMFFASSALYWILTYVGIIIFIGLTAYNTQRVKRMTLSALQQGDALMEQRVGIIGALSLYLDFVNLFLLLLRLAGRRR